LVVKFFIQKDLPQQVQADLCETITSLGGRVEAKVPRQGYILVQPGTPEEERLRLCWTSPDRPERHFVPYTYVDACKIAGMLLKQIFVENSSPIKMHIHPSIANVNARAALSQRVMHSGGDPHASPQSARVILADPNTEIFQHLVKSYQGVPNKYIESYLWVKKCIDKEQVVYTPLVYKNPGGRRPGEERTQFTEEDEQNLCNWIAAKIPYKETGGRTGNRLYQQLCELSGDSEYAWVTRHTWQSWRERYKKNASRLDAIISQIVDQKKPAQGEKGQYGYVRMAEEKPKRQRKKRSSKDSENLADEEFTTSVPAEGLVHNSTMPPMPPGHVIPLHGTMSIHEHEHLQVVQGLHHEHNGLYAASILPGPSDAPPPPPPLTSQSRTPLILERTEEELDDGEEESEWAVRVGNAPPPAWGKRKAVEQPEEQPESKKSHTETSTMEQATLSTQAVMAIANIHVIDQSIREIAKECRFTVEEVQEYYDKCGEMGNTRVRFQKMRAMLQDKFGDEVT
ncbi:hypothetical protein AMATHDRAFT_134906, partial [Amanita thiersii Skay4041]